MNAYRPIWIITRYERASEKQMEKLLPGFGFGRLATGATVPRSASSARGNNCVRSEKGVARMAKLMSQLKTASGFYNKNRSHKVLVEKK